MGNAESVSIVPGDGLAVPRAQRSVKELAEKAHEKGVTVRYAIRPHKAKTILEVKRSMAAGYDGLDNDLFYTDKTMIVFGDAKKVVEAMLKAV